MMKGRSNGETGKILQGMCIAVFCKGFAVVFSYLLHFVLARMLGSDGLGLFALAFAIVISASFLGRFGLDYVLLRHAALYSSSGQMGVLAAWCRKANLFAGGMALTLTIGITVLGQWFCTEVFGKTNLYMPLIAMTAGLIPQTLLFLQAETLKGASCIRASQMLQGDGGGVLVFGAALCLSLPLAIPYGVTGAAMGFALASWVAYFAGCGMSARLFAGAHPQDQPAFASLLKNRAFGKGGRCSYGVPVNERKRCFRRGSIWVLPAFGFRRCGGVPFLSGHFPGRYSSAKEG